MNSALLRLVICQGLFLTNNVTFIAINGLVGLQLAPAPWMATLPLMGYVVGGAIATPFVARHQRRWGRRRAFQAGLVAAIATTLSCAAAVTIGSFALLVAATLSAGYYNANAALYRFAAADVVAPEAKAKAISWVLTGGLLGAVFGPNLATIGRDLLAIPFVGAYYALAALALLSLAIVSTIPFPPMEQPDALRPGRPLREIARQSTFVAAVASAALGYGMMNLLMAATPLAMAGCGHPFDRTALVLEVHVIGMFAPGFFTGALIRRFGTTSVVSVGCGLYALCIAVALTGVDMPHFVVSLALLGVGWNFIYTGATMMLTGTYRPEEKTTAQGAMDFCVYSTMALTSLGAGALVTSKGWTWLNVGSLGLLAALVAALVWQALRRPAGGMAARG
ncbi:MULTISPECIES: MFS transporter [unclassified Rubrivivax]|uniref:MFS transporter n=1 Tax=unclassified Rubrivivax TaxID=2649762 RepID=UPI001E514500|nr:MULTISPECIES: MFS transporter [unclassified Rubrivivax]MCC9597968.1 MFS transporter [Rubrivivax sp. JA1055]MCC9645775.1 MFS transporter [Rubrivivax sp. JA1029]